jgi:hypothetical protein
MYSKPAKSKKSKDWRTPVFRIVGARPESHNILIRKLAVSNIEAQILGQLVTILVQDFTVETESLKNGTHFCVKNCPWRN